MKLNKISLALSASLVLSSSAYATLKSDKVTLNSNMTLTYTKTPPKVYNLENIFKEGIFYGRIRTNLFNWDWDNPTSKTKDNYALGVGGSVIYKSASFKGLSTTFGLYTSQNPSFYRMDVSDIKYLKAGKDTLSRRDTSKTGKFGMNVLGQAYLQYDALNSSFYLGRQLFESTFTASSDAKMIPNTFDGLSVTSNIIPNTTLKLAYFTKQKLRDHTSSHNILAYNPTGNDDSAVNRNLTVARIGDDNKLFITEVKNKSIQNLQLNLSYMSVFNVVSNIAFETKYKIKAFSWTIIPALRYMKQIDDLDASYGVANLKKDQTGYSNPNSLNGSLIAAKLDLQKDALKLRFGYSKISDDADIISPWRAAPTGGYTRAMGQYNWYANTKTYMLQASYDFSKAKLIDGFSISTRYAMQDFDDTKPGVQADSDVFHVDLRQNIGNDLEAKIRFARAMGEATATKSDPSYTEYRVELNYFF